jgi:hypothetical protein
MSTNVDTDLNLFNFIRKHFLQICIRKVTVHLWKVLEMMSTSVDTDLNPFNFICKHFLQNCLCDVSYVRSYCSFNPLSVHGQPWYTADFAAPHR